MDGRATVYCLNTPEEREDWDTYVDLDGGGAGAYTGEDILIFDTKVGKESACQYDMEYFRLYLVTLHELGRALGLGHSEDQRAVMYKKVVSVFYLDEDGWPKLTDTDLEMFCAIRKDCKK